MARTTHDDGTTPARPRLHVALELSLNTWKLALATSRAGKARIRDVKARDLPGLLAAIQAAKAHLGLPEDAPVVSCYEAGRDGFWIHRFLAAHGIANVVIDPASIEVNRRSRRPKTDRIDAQKLAQLLTRHHDGEDVLRVVRVPSVEAEDERRLPRRLRTLKRRRVQTTNRIQAALFQHGVELSPRKLCFNRGRILAALGRARQWDGAPLPPELEDDVRMFVDQCDLLTRQIRTLEKRQRELLRQARRGARDATPAQRKAALLSELRGVGDVGSYVLTTEFFGWRTFHNRKEVGALAGLTGTPHQSGGPGREQGISKAGNPRVRLLMVELSWLWLRFQPKSRTTLWFHEHVGKAGSRGKRKAIVAVARKLLVEFWHFVEHGVVPDGAVLTDGSEPGHAQAAA